MLLIGNKSGNGTEKIYTKQIYVYDGKVYAEIIYQDLKTEKDWEVNLWYSTMSKSFGRILARQPREKDYIAAHQWADKQLQLLDKYCTVKLKEAQMFIDARIYQRNNSRPI